MDRKYWSYLLIRIFVAPFSILPISWIHQLGKGFGILGFYLMRNYRKRTLSNLALAKDLSLTKNEILEIGKKSFQNLAITCLEYSKFSFKKDLSKIIRCENPETAQALHDQGKGIIFFCAHQANWEALFLDGTTRMRGVAIGRPVKNKYLYRWIVSIREKFGGKIIEPRNALREGVRALKKGAFLGIVGDQGRTDSGYSSPFFGRKAWTSKAPAFLSYRTNTPIIFAETRRVGGGYRIHYYDPIWPDLTQPMEEEIENLMSRLLKQLEESIKRSPGEWLWQHKRWKQPDSHNVLARYSYDCIGILLPDDPSQILPHLPTLKQIYQHHFLIFMAPKGSLLDGEEILYYENLGETLLEDYRFKLVFNFTEDSRVKEHYMKLSAFKVLDLSQLEKLAAPHLPEELKDNLSEILKRALCHPGTMWQPHGR